MIRNITLATAIIAVALCSSTPSFGVNLWYDFEGDSGRVARDKFADDGAHDGALLGDVLFISDASGLVPYGSQAALFEAPTPVNPPYSTFEIPGSTGLGDSFTLAMHANVPLEGLTRSRLISSFGGSGPVGTDRVLFDFDPAAGIRAIVNNTSVANSETPAGLADPGYHHYAMTVNSGDLRLYFDGVEIGAGDVGLGYTNSVNLFVGEDPHDKGGSANEQFTGVIDDVLVLNQALSATDIMSLAMGASAQSVVSPAGAYAVNYDFEGASPLADKFVDDGAQNAVPTLTAGVVAGAGLGGGAAGSLSDASLTYDKFSQIATPITGTDLGEEFTVSAVVNMATAGYKNGGLARVFSTYGGGGSAAGRFILDINPDADVSGIGVRFLLPDGTNVTSSEAFSYNEDHTITAVYDAGDVRLYMDGVEIAAGATSGVVDLGEFSLMIGEDLGGAVNENFLGAMDDVLILDRALSGRDVQLLANLGVEGFQAVPEPSSLVLVFVSAVALFSIRCTRRRS